MHHFSRRCSWQDLTDKTITSRYSTTSLRLLHDHHCAILTGLARDLGMLLTVMEAGGGASAPDVQDVPPRYRGCSWRGGAGSGRNLAHNRPAGIDWSSTAGRNASSLTLFLPDNRVYPDETIDCQGVRRTRPWCR